MKKGLLPFIVLTLFFPTVVFAKDSSINKFSVWGTGRASKIELNDEHCGFLPEGCQAKVSGEWTSIIFGHSKFSAELDTAWQNSKTNGTKGYCAPITGTVIVQTENKDDQVYASINGIDCDILFSSEVLPHKYNGKFVIIGGTGKYVNAEGEGIFRAIDYGKYRSFFSASGEIRTL